METQISHGLMRSDERETCTICLYEFEPDDTGVVRLERCSDHFFHKDCMEQCRGNKNYIKCPICEIIYGEMTGDMPAGQMRIRYMSVNSGYCCEGYPGVGVICISYGFRSGR